MSKSTSNEIDSVTFVAYPKLFFVWPLIVAGYLFYFIGSGMEEGGTGLEVLGWTYITVIGFVLLTLGIDVTRNQAIVWAVLILALWVGGLYLQDVQGLPLLSDIYGWLAGLDAAYDPGFGLALSIVMTVPFLVMLGHSYLDDRWRITHNEFEHYSFGRMNDSLGRGAKTIRTEFPDVFELLLGMSGTLIVFNATGTKELRRIPHIMFLPFVRTRLNRILERTAITAALSEAEEDDDDDV